MPRSRDDQEDYQMDAAFIEKLHKLVKMRPKYFYQKIWPQIRNDLCAYIMDEAPPFRSQLLGLTVIESILMSDFISLEERMNIFTHQVKKCLVHLLQYDLHKIIKKVLHILYSVPFPVDKLLSKADMKRIVRLVFCKNTSTGLEAAKALLIIKLNGNQPSLMDLLNIYVEAKNDSPTEFVNVFFETFKNIKWPDWCSVTIRLLEAIETTEIIFLKYIELLTAFIRASCLGSNSPKLQMSPSSVQRENRKKYTQAFLKDIVRILKYSQKFSNNDRIMHFVIDLMSNFVLSLIPASYLCEILEEFEVIWNRTTSMTTITTVCKIIKHWELYFKKNEQLLPPLKQKMTQLHLVTFNQVMSQIEFSGNVIIGKFEEFKLHTVGRYFDVDVLYPDIWYSCLDKIDILIAYGREKDVTILLTYMSKLMEKNLKTAFADINKNPELINTSLVLTIKKSMQIFLPTLRTIIRNERIQKTCVGEACAELAKICLRYFTCNWARSNNPQYRILLPDGLIFEDENFQPLIEEFLKM